MPTFLDKDIHFLLHAGHNHKFLSERPFFYKLNFFRRKQALEDLAVKPVTQFPVEISNEDAFASFKNVRHVTIKKVK